ncbi:MAG: WYL domain-containing protein [Archangium sp.]|nr:WYL domain-containing protein [Archangium sp.]
MDRTERLLNLVAFFLDARAPMSLDAIRDAFPDDYSGSNDASQRKFERDKAELYELGIPLRYEQKTDDEDSGYLLDREAYYLPEPGFSADELAVLYAAGSAALTSGAFPGRQDLAHALRKIGFFADTPIPAAQVRLEVSNAKDLAARLETIWAAIGARKSLDLDYFSPRARAATTRKVDPWGLALRRGVWNLVGWCHLRKELRTFHVNRIRRVTLLGTRPRQPDFDIPEKFSIDDHVANWPWEYRIHEPLEVTLSLDETLAPLSQQLFGTPARGGTLRVTVTHLDALLDQVLSMGTSAKVIGPSQAKDRLRERAQRVLSVHTGAQS